MALTRPRKSHPGHLPRWDQRHESVGVGPRLGFAVAILACLAAWAASKATLSPDAAVPIVSSLFLVFAGVFGVIAWRRGRMNPDNVTYADVAGALTLIGLFAAATIEPDQLVRLVDSGSTE